MCDAVQNYAPYYRETAIFCKGRAEIFDEKENAERKQAQRAQRQQNFFQTGFH